VAIGCITGMVNQYYQYKGEQAKRRTEDGDLDEKLARLERLERRVEVLEAIVTDKQYDLRRQLDDLERAGPARG
ncbi:MAG: hypothetical protein AAFX85_15050, partial [Pseudomonadota bacterium]